MVRTATVVWSVIGVVLAVLVVLGLIYGPDLYREGKAVIGPIVELTKVEDALAGLNDEFPFTIPGDGTVGGERFDTFLEIRRELQPKYRGWDDLIRRVDDSNVEDWQTAKEVLGATQDVMVTQVEVLRTHRMSPAEFTWIEDLVYDTWARAIAGTAESDALIDEVRSLTSDDLSVLADVERDHGSSSASRAFRAHLERRLHNLENPDAPAVEGVSDADAALFWNHREEIVELDFSGYGDLHEAIGGAADVRITIDPE